MILVDAYLAVGVALAEACAWNKRAHDVPRDVDFTRATYLSIVLLWPWHAIEALI